MQRRLRALPSRTGVYFVLALGLFPGLGSCRGKLTAGLAGMDVPRPSEKALRDLRRRLGPAPLKVLFEVVAGPLAWPSAPGVRFAGLRTVAFDGCNSVKIPDTVRNFTSALEAAREELTAARGVCPDGPPDLPGVIGRAVLSTLLPARRARFSARKVKCATSRYLNRDDGRPAPLPPSPRSTSPSAPRRRRAPAGPAATPQPSPGRRSRPPVASSSPPSSPASPPETGAATNSPCCCRSNPAACSPSSANGPCSRLLHTHRLRHLPAQHAAQPSILDNHARHLTTRPCGAMASPASTGRPLARIRRLRGRRGGL